MCFSAEASFAAAAVLGGIGIASLKNGETKSMWTLAIIPIIFAFQQFFEGVLWLSLKHQISLGFLTVISPYIFIFSALIFWPLWIPFSLLWIEKKGWRRTIQSGCFFCGALIVIYFVSALTSAISTIRIYEHHIQYQADILNLTPLYAIVILLPWFVSSLKSTKLFGFLLLISFLSSKYFYEHTYISVWCFFAGILSIILYYILKENSTSKASTEIS